MAENSRKEIENLCEEKKKEKNTDEDLLKSRERAKKRRKQGEKQKISGLATKETVKAC